LIIPDYQAWTGKSGKYEQSSVYAVMVAPLLIGKRLVGAIASVHSDPERKFGPDDLRLLVDKLHQAGIGVILDWVPAHFPKDEWALARFDGTPLYEHADPGAGHTRIGERWCSTMGATRSATS